MTRPTAPLLVERADLSVHQHLTSWVAAFNARDWAAMTSRFAEGYVGLDHRPLQAELLDVATIVAGWRMIAEFWPEVRGRVEAAKTLGNAFCAYLVVECTTTEDAVDGASAPWRGVHVWVAGIAGQDGCAMRLEYFIDEHAAARAFTRLQVGHS